MTLTNNQSTNQSKFVQFQGAKCCFWSSLNNLLLPGKHCLDLYVRHNFTLMELDSNDIFSMSVITLILLENKIYKPSYLLTNDISKFYLNVRSILYNSNCIDTTVISCYVPPRQLIGNVLINIFLYLYIKKY
jgi:hypothetical protein